MESIIAKHIYVSGKVQGVYYRKFTEEKAHQLKLKGWVMNLSDGRVEIHVEGEADEVQELVDWCASGSPMAAVDDVHSEPTAVENFKDFSIRY